MTRDYAWSLCGSRAHGHAPRNWGDNVSLLGAIALDGWRALATLERALDTPAFEAFVESCLAPSLKPGDIVLWDNLGVHKAPAARRAIEAKGAQLVWLPPYSPDFNPIENCWSKLKALLKAAGARTRDALETAIAEAMRSITASDTAGWFRHAGYRTHSD